MYAEMKPFSDAVNRVNQPGKAITQYIRDNKGRRRGVIFAFKDDHWGDKAVYVGFSLYKRNEEMKKGVKFNRDIGLAHAYRNSWPLADLLTGLVTHKIPHSIRNEVNEFVERANRYFNNPNPRTSEPPPAEPVNTHLNDLLKSNATPSEIQNILNAQSMPEETRKLQNVMVARESSLVKELGALLEAKNPDIGGFKTLDLQVTYDPVTQKMLVSAM